MSSEGMPLIREDVNTFMTACEQVSSPENTALYWKLVQEEFDELTEAMNKADATEVLDACADLIWVIIGMTIAAKLPITVAWYEVTKSNHAKIGSDGFVQRREDGKIQKPQGWQPPQIAQIVDTYARNNFIEEAVRLIKAARCIGHSSKVPEQLPLIVPKKKAQSDDL